MGMACKQAALILLINSHFYRTPRSRHFSFSKFGVLLYLDQFLFFADMAYKLLSIRQWYFLSKPQKPNFWETNKTGKFSIERRITSGFNVCLGKCSNADSHNFLYCTNGRSSTQCRPSKHSHLLHHGLRCCCCCCYCCYYCCCYCCCCWEGGIH